jgi:hypothetical protein
MKTSSLRVIKGLICLACIAVYAYFYQEYIKLPLFDMIKDFPILIRRLLLILSLLPLWLVAIYFVFHVLKPSRNIG